MISETDSWTRRRFLGSCLTGAGALALPATVLGAGRKPARTKAPVLRLGQILPEGGDAATREAAARGAALGAEEAGRTAELLGSRLELLVHGAGDPAAVAREAEALVKEGSLVLIGGLDAASRAALGEASDRLSIPFLTTRSPDDPADGEPVGRHRYHVASNARLRREALDRWLAGEGQGAAAKRDTLKVVDWHPALVRYGAEQLNQRFADRFGAEMGPLAWASWLAVLVAAETALRNPDARGSELSARIGTLLFDGHKGIRLSFDTADHELRQPLYVVAGDEVVGEVAPPGEAP
jgi:hypothetical protein